MSNEGTTEDPDGKAGSVGGIGEGGVGSMDAGGTGSGDVGVG